jgi:hypothetical protein
MPPQDESAIASPVGGTNTVVSRQCTLDGFVDAVSDRDGLGLGEVEPLGTLLARTENSVYRIIPLEAGSSRILIQGGRFFPEPTEVRLAGSGFGGSFLKLGWIGLGLRMEILWDGQRIITSRIRAVQVQKPATVGTRPS